MLGAGSERSELGLELTNIAKAGFAVFGSCGLRSRRADEEENRIVWQRGPVYIVFLVLCWIGEDKALLDWKLGIKRVRVEDTMMPLLC